MMLSCVALFTGAVALLPQLGIAQATPIENATDIKAQPLALLAKFPDAGPAMARFVAQQLTQQPAAVDAMLSIINDTSPAQASAIGAGMVRAARLLSGKQPAAARAITEKVMRSDNRYLTTTYSSLGPRYNPNAPFVAFASLPPREALAMVDGIGAAWRVGPAESENLADRDGKNPDDIIENCRYNTINKPGMHCRGMIVALIISNASHNGAVSTSPTI